MKSPEIPVDQIKCPECGAPIPITETIHHQIAERTKEELKAETLEQRKAIAIKEQDLQNKEASIEKTIQDRLKAAQSKIQAEAIKAAREDLSVEIEDLRRQTSEKDQKLQQAQKLELELRQQKRALEDREQSLAVETARTIDAQRQTIQEETTKRFQDEYRLKDAEKEKKLRDALKTNDELRRKLEQGSQQTQGEVAELHLEELLRSAFPTDRIDPVPKGITGADIVQSVVTKNGHSCGTIIWEMKRTKAWGDSWISKLKDDQRYIKADIAILVSEALPKDCTHFKQVNGVWITNPQCALNLAIALRMQLEQVAVTQLAAVGKNEKMEVLFRYLSGPEFKQRVEAIVETFIELQTDLQEERRVAEKRWSKREKQIQKVIANTSGMHGDLQGLIGSSLQAIPALTETITSEAVATGDVVKPRLRKDEDEIPF